MVGCPTCGAELTFIEPYGRHYCYGCRSYAPRNLRACPACGRALVFVQDHRQFYCYGCQAYQEDPRSRHPCPTCGDELEFLAEYNRFYCYACEQYAPRGYGIAPAGGRRTSVTPAEAGDPSIGFAPFSREELDLASKEQLIDWCKEYGLEASGMKYELRLRLLEHVRKQGLLLRGEEPVEGESAEDAPSPQEIPAEAPPDTGPSPAETVVAAGGEQETVETSAAEAAEAPSAPEEPAPTGSGDSCHRCGYPLTYIPQYDRHYCYNCGTYAPAPGSARPRARRPGQAVGTRGVKIRRETGGNPMVGIGLAVVGLLMYLADMLLFTAPGVFDLPVFVTGRELHFALSFLSVLFVGVGLIAAVMILRPQR